MRSFGVLYTFWPLDASPTTNGMPVAEVEKPRATNLTADLHINYWELDDTVSNGSQFLDFGLLIKKAALDVEAITFFFPFEVRPNDVEDLGAKLKSEQMISALFNEDYNCDSNTGTSYTTVRKKGEDKVDFYIYELAKTNFEVSKVSDFGSILKVSILSRPPVGEPASTECNVYIRFRLNNIHSEGLFYEERISNDYIQSAFYKTKMLDFRVNERREMSNKLLEVLEFSNRHFVGFEKFHFYYVGSSRKEKVEGTVNYNDCRLLDYSQWSNYLPQITKGDKRFLCYHWKTYNNGAVFQSCSVFMRTVFKSLNIKIITIYSLIAIGLSFVASALWGFLYHFFI